MNTNTTSLAGRSFSELLAMIRLGFIDTPDTVLTVDLDDDLIMTDHGDVDVMDHVSHARINYDHHPSAGEMVDVIAENMAHWGAWPAVVWFAGERVHFSHCDAINPGLARKGN